MMSFENLYRRYYPKLYSLAVRLTGSGTDAEDVLQTAFMNAYRSFDRFRGDSSPYTWLYRIVVNEAKKFSRERKKLPVEEYTEEHNITEAEFYGVINRYGRTEDDVLTELTRETCLQMFMNCMPGKYRTLYTLRIILHCSTAETAEILGISREAVKTGLHRARKIIQSHFEGRCSLIKPGSLCNCRGYAAYLEKSGKTGLLLDVQVAARKEKKAAEQFRSELKELWKIEELYTESAIMPPSWSRFTEQIRERMDGGHFTLLET